MGLTKRDVSDWLRRLRRYRAPFQDADYDARPRPFSGLRVPDWSLEPSRSADDVSAAGSPRDGDDDDRCGRDLRLTAADVRVQDVMSVEVAQRWGLMTAQYRQSLSYEHLWFSWELLRRVPRHWRRHAWWSPEFEGSLMPEHRAMLAYRLRVQEEWDQRWTDAFGGVETTRGVRFAAPDEAGACPTGAEADEVELLALLGCFVRPAVLPALRAGDREIYPAPPGSRSFRLLQIDLSAPRGDIEAALNALRISEGVDVRRCVPTDETWGRRISARRAIEILDRVTDVDGTHAASVNALAKEELDRSGGRDLRTARRTLTSLGQRLLDQLRRDPLRALRARR